jgi:hypothetical protein
VQPPDFVTLFIAPLNDLGIPYMVTGAVAAVIYGEPGFTHDLDVVMTLAPADADRIAAVFPATDFYVPPREVILEETARPEHGHFTWGAGSLARLGHAAPRAPRRERCSGLGGSHRVRHPAEAPVAPGRRRGGPAPERRSRDAAGQRRGGGPAKRSGTG